MGYIDRGEDCGGGVAPRKIADSAEQGRLGLGLGSQNFRYTYDFWGNVDLIYY